MIAPAGPHKVTIEIDPNAFTQVSNKILVDARLTPAEKGVYAQCVRVATAPGLPDPRSWEQFAALAGIPARSFLRHRQKLCELGLFRLKKGGRLLVVTDSFYEDEEEEEIKEFDVIYEKHEEESEPDISIAKALDEEPKRKKQMATVDRWKLIREAWDKYKEEDWSSFRKNTGTKMAIELMMKRLDISHDDYDRYMGAVMKAVQESNWWSDKPKTMGAIFGHKGELTDNQIYNKENLYKSGQGLFAALPKGGRFNWKDESLVLKLFNNARRKEWKGSRLEELPDFDKIVHIQVPDSASWVKDVAAYFWPWYLYHENRVEHVDHMRDPAMVDEEKMQHIWMQPGRKDVMDRYPEAFKAGTVHLFYCQELDYPVAWTGQVFDQHIKDEEYSRRFTLNIE